MHKFCSGDIRDLNVFSPSNKAQSQSYQSVDYTVEEIRGQRLILSRVGMKEEQFVGAARAFADLRQVETLFLKVELFELERASHVEVGYQPYEQWPVFKVQTRVFNQRNYGSKTSYYLAKDGSCSLIPLANSVRSRSPLGSWMAAIPALPSVPGICRRKSIYSGQGFFLHFSGQLVQLI